MRREGNLFSAVVSFENLYKAALKACRGKKMKKPVASFFFHLENEIILLQEELISGSYRPQPYRQFEIREPKVREICSSTFRDRVVHHAICNLMEPIFEKRLIFDTYACRDGKGAHAAIKRLQFFTRKQTYFLKCNIRKYFQSVNHEILKQLLRRVIKDDRLLSLMELIIDHAVPGSEPGKGIPIGNLTSQHFANFYLGELDHFVKERYGLQAYVRYMDDFICLAQEKQILNNLLGEIRIFIHDRLRLRLKEKVTRMAPVSEGVPFLGFRTFPQMIRLQRPNLIRLRKKMRQREAQFKRGLIDQEDLICSVRSMIAHVTHANSTRLRRREFEQSLSLA
ncbi:MAG: RNA-dependent DNA polymerase [Deltaproteobacteria bacterium CG11_big_fil_rev_8_21_14_0_20_45_16]|nr:MAG: RNA-dependent DNA polymerase [Deltaproteobacteria bacterium CG11_big_fil_rev_8_21_14_0_20_45_16]